MTFYERLLNPDVYYAPRIDWDAIRQDVLNNLKISNSRKIQYYEIPIAFDIETTSFLSTRQEKVACMYSWGISIKAHVILGRTWGEFLDVYDEIVKIFNPSEKRRIIIYIQNLPYEFQFMCHRLNWEKVFALDERKPLTALTSEWVEFRCSYALSGMSLQKIGENLQRYKIEKMVGDLDYSKPRHHKTPLTDKEWKYQINDVQVVCAYIQETAENDGGYNKIPLTKTGYVRNYCRSMCFADRHYRFFIKSLTLDLDEYKQLKRAFAGGFTHANWHYSCKVHENVDSFDFTSSYPYVMVAEKFPMSKSRLVQLENKAQFFSYLKTHCCLFDVELNKLDGWDAPDHIISRSKCSVCDNPIIDNGRIITADRVVITITEVDWESIVRFYKFESFRITNFRVYEKNYLPHAFVKAILKLYADKTELKDVPGKEVEYMKSKGMVNSAYGMSVTDIVRDEDTFNEEWVKNKADSEEAIKEYNENKNRFLFYPWGIWVTAYARRNLFTGIYEYQEDYIYSDTDSVKVKNAKAHSKYMEEYNRTVALKLQKACEHHNIPVSLTRPKTIKGKEKPLGVWDHDGTYSNFKTLGAKRYMVESKGKISITVAGLGKSIARDYIVELAKKKGISPFDVFNEELYIPGEHTGKSIHTYFDYEFSDILVDYTGQAETVHEYSGINLAPAEYSLSLDREYLALIGGRKFVRE